MGQSESVRDVSGRGGNGAQRSPRSFTAGDGGGKTILGKYTMDTTRDGLMGEGSFSTCRRGKTIATGEACAIKYFKAKLDPTQLFKFERQISVLKDLQAPFKRPSNPRLWCPALEKALPERMFMRLFDYSKDANGRPGADAKEGVPYVITELAQYSLLDYLAQRKRDNEPLSHATVKSITKAILIVIAGLHAKGLVHLDLKPENLMVFDGCMKLIDVDGCIQIDSTVSISDPSISFSPCYCAPEWARFLVDSNHAQTIRASPGLDVWSVGCTVCELVTLDAIMKPMYANFLRRAHSHREASFLFFDWLRSLRTCPTPRQIQAFDDGLLQLIAGSLMVCSKEDRKTCAEALSHPYFRDAINLHRSKTNPLTHTADEEITHEVNHDLSKHMPAEQVRVKRHRVEDNSRAVLHAGSIWKLNSGKDPMDRDQWLHRDMWISSNGSLCYYSQLEGKKLVLLDSHHLHGAEIVPEIRAARPNAFQIKTTHIEHSGEEIQVFTFAGTTAEECSNWQYYMSKAVRMEEMPTMRLGADIAHALNEYKLSVRNRRMKADANDSHFEPVFKGILYKVKASGDKKIEKHWFKREMWLAKNGSFCYWSQKDNRELIYYTSADVSRCKISKIPDSESIRKYAFQVTLPPLDDIEFAPGEFSAESETHRERWLQEFQKAAGGHNSDDVDCLSGFMCCVKQ